MSIPAQTITQNLEALLQKVTALPYVLQKLEETGIRYGLYAGSHVTVLVNNRVPTDVDLLVHDDDLPKLQAAFPFGKTKDTGKGVFLYVGNDDVIEFMGQAYVSREGESYPFRLTDLAAQHLVTHSISGHSIRLVDPVDTLLLKALLRRGPEQGKHDLEDIEAVLAKTQLDSPYLTARLAEVNATEATRGIWQKYGLMK